MTADIQMRVSIHVSLAVEKMCRQQLQSKIEITANTVKNYFY